ncbi:hypothetical protein AGLY_016956 [Aphis glycines]|uniref:SAM domain-containing protein n=1 Tax=Aphis glycines TaxID=307491 RepID=A0A6G0SY88_APHGL|nr:hypothetical protein AGLY_016956 [Aphis glycines]
MSNDEILNMWDILNSWNLECVYQTCIDQLIDTGALKSMKSKHIGLLLTNFPLGIHIKFEKHLEEYQKNQRQQLDVSILKSKLITETPVQNLTSQNTKPPAVGFDLNDILIKSTQGSMIIDYYYKQKKTMTIDLADNISNAIVKSFPTEIKDVYFLKDFSCKAPKGKVYAKYFNTMKRLKDVGLKSTKKIFEDKSILSRSSQDQMDFYLNENESGSVELTNILINDEDLSWPEIETIWRKTVNFRLKFIKENNTSSIFKKWVHYTKPLGYKLVEIDFCHMYSKFKNLSVKFGDKLSTLLQIFDDRVKDSGNGKFLTMLYLLHSLFIPTSKKVTLDENGKKSTIKFSIRDSQNIFILVAPTAVELELIINKLKSQSNSIQPCILVVGSLLYPKQVLVYFDDVKYKLLTVLKAIDVCFKIFHVFNLEYPLECSNVWLFLQVYFYEISTKYDKSCNLVRQICSELDSQ